MDQLICKRNRVGYSLRSQTDLFFPQVKSVNYSLKALRYFGLKIWNIIPNDIKNSKHFENSQRKLSHGFHETVLVESVKIKYCE